MADRWPWFPPRSYTVLPLFLSKNVTWFPLLFAECFAQWTTMTQPCRGSLSSVPQVFQLAAAALPVPCRPACRMHQFMKAEHQASCVPIAKLEDVVWK